MLIDPGSELTFVSRQLIETLQIPRRRASIPIIGIGGSHSERTRGAVPLTPLNLFFAIHQCYCLYPQEANNVTALYGDSRI